MLKVPYCEKDLSKKETEVTRVGGKREPDRGRESENESEERERERERVSEMHIQIIFTRADW